MILQCCAKHPMLTLILLCQFFTLHTTNARRVGPSSIINGNCSFGKSSVTKRNEMVASARIRLGPLGQLSTLSCNVWYNRSEGILRMWVQQSSVSNQTYIVATVLDDKDALVLSDHVAEAKESVAYQFHICAPKHLDSRHYSIMLLAPPDTLLNLTVQLDESLLREGETKSLTFSDKTTSQILVVDVPRLQSIHDHFLVTLRSNDTTQEGILIISNQCSDVSALDTHDGETDGSLYLTFTTFGRITLSHASRPQLAPGRWYIGIFLKQSPKKNTNFEKNVEVSVGFAGGVNRWPVVNLFLISLFGGIVIAVFAEFFLNPEYEHRFIHDFHYYVNTRFFRGSYAPNNVLSREQVDVAVGDQKNDQRDRVVAPASENNTGNIELTVRDAGKEPTPSPSICLYTNQAVADVSSTDVCYDETKLHVRRHWPGLKVWAGVFFSWFYDEGKTFGYMTIIVAFSLLTGAAQFIILNWQAMIESGDRDTCYYNEGCYRATTNVDMPYNLIISNISYLIHGVIFALSLSLREATHLVNHNVKADSRCMRKNFSVYYALAWALVFEGVFSSFYHICPSRLTFQFDSAFMFVISGLVIVAVFNSITEKYMAARGLSIETCKQSTGKNIAPIQDTKMFLFFVVPLLVLNYLGSIRDTSGLLMIPEPVFYILVILWILGMFFWAFYRLMLPWHCDSSDPGFWCKFAWLCVLYPFLLLIIGVFTIRIKQDWSHFFLYTCLMSVVVAVMGYCLSKCTRNIYKRVQRRGDLTSSQQQGLQWRLFLKWPVVNLHAILYIVGMGVCWAFAFHYFQRKAVTAKVKLPSQSRELNEECVLWEFFDYHDLWHILSSFALLLSAYLTIWCVG